MVQGDASDNPLLLISTAVFLFLLLGVFAGYGDEADRRVQHVPPTWSRGAVHQDMTRGYDGCRCSLVEVCLPLTFNLGQGRIYLSTALGYFLTGDSNAYTGVQVLAYAPDRASLPSSRG